MRRQTRVLWFATATLAWLAAAPAASAHGGFSVRPGQEAVVPRLLGGGGGRAGRGAGGDRRAAPARGGAAPAARSAGGALGRPPGLPRGAGCGDPRRRAAAAVLRPHRRRRSRRGVAAHGPQPVRLPLQP